MNTAAVAISGLFIAVGAGVGALINGYSFPTALGKVFNGFMRKNKRTGTGFDPLKFISTEPGGKIIGELILHFCLKFIHIYMDCFQKPEWIHLWRVWTRPLETKE